MKLDGNTGLRGDDTHVLILYGPHSAVVEAMLQ